LAFAAGFGAVFAAAASAARQAALNMLASTKVALMIFRVLIFMRSKGRGVEAT
jgi:hypothetical protein